MPFAWAAALLETARDDVQAQAKAVALCNQLVMRAPSLEARCAARNQMIAAGVLDAAENAAEAAETADEAEAAAPESVDPGHGAMQGDLVLIEKP